MGVTTTTTWHHIRRSPYQAMAAVITVFITLLLTGIFFLGSVGSVFVLQYFEGKPQIIAFFKDTATESDIVSLQKTLESSGNVASVRYVSKDQALSTYKELNKNDPLLLEMVTADILPASLEVSALTPSGLSGLEELLRTNPLIEDVAFQKEVVDTLIAWTNALRLVGGVFAALLIIDAILTLMTVIGMKISSRQEEIAILSLIGASPSYIRAPFIMEGVLYGIWGASAAWVTITAALLWLRPFILAFLSEVPVIHMVLANPTDSLFLLSSGVFFLGLLVVGAFFGIAGSLVAVNRYLKSP